MRFFYKCPICGHEYLEQRSASEPQYFTKCGKCSVGVYEEVKQEA